MTDVVVDPTKVLITGTRKSREVVAAVAITQGQVVKMDGTLAQANDVDQAALLGVALNAANVGQPVDVAVGANVGVGTAAVVAGELYVLSAATPGGIAPFSDLTTGQFQSILGFAPDANTITLEPWVSGLARP